MTATDGDSVEVVDEPARQRYEARIGDRVAGFTDYRAVRGRVILIHTEVDALFEGRGIGSRLASGALDDIRARGLKVTVKCPFIAAFLKRHPEYLDLVATEPDVRGVGGAGAL
jgi:predicted GNAT family acetyltransferase